MFITANRPRADSTLGITSYQAIKDTIDPLLATQALFNRW